MNDEIPFGYCQCGCGHKTQIATRSYHDRGIRKGGPLRFLPGHSVSAPRKPRPLPILIPHFNFAIVPLVGDRAESNGLVALVSIEDLHLVCDHRWRALVTQGKAYAVTSPVGDRAKSLLMHRVVGGDPDGLMVDHISGNGLDNRRCNVRFATRLENQRNRLRNHRSAPHRGVWQQRPNGKWRAHISINHKTVVIGYFDTAIEAARAYDEAARAHFGEFARLNFPNHGEQAA